MRIHHISILCFIGLQLAGQDVGARIRQYNNAVRNCATAGCTAVAEKDAAEEAAAGIIETLIKAPPPILAARIFPTATIDTNEARRVALRLLPDRQQGASGGMGGGTSLASLAAVSELIAGAMESGAFQKDTVGTVSTIRANAIGAYRLFTGDCPKGAIQAYPACVSEDRSAWRGLSTVFSFDSSRNDQPAPGNATDPANSVNALFLRARNGLATAGVRYEFFKRADLSANGPKETWKANLSKLKDTGAAYAAAVAEGPAKIVVPGLLDNLPAKLHAALINLPEAERRAAAEKLVMDFVIAKNLTIPKDKWDQFQSARKAHLKSEVEFFRTTLDRSLFTLEYTHRRPKDEPEYGGLTFIYGDTVGKHEETVTLDGAAETVIVPTWNLTLNAGLNFFYDKQTVQKDRSLRDFHAAFQADRKLWRWKFLNTPTFTVAGYYQRLTDDAVLSFNSDAIAPAQVSFCRSPRT